MARKKGRASRQKRQVDLSDYGRLIRQGAKGAYPSEEERAEILIRREEILQEVLEVMWSSPDPDPEPMALDFLDEYSQQDVAVVLNALNRNMPSPLPALDSTRTYRGYRRAFARFGGERRLLSRAEYTVMSAEQAALLGRRMNNPVLQAAPGKREVELGNLTLSGHYLWEDITPPAAPIRPEDFQPPAPGIYPPLVQNLYDWGIDEERQKAARAVGSDRQKWQEAVPDLQRMALDEGLLSGWPNDSAAWAPEHALVVLGALRLNDPALGSGMAALAALADRPDDWLSDLLPSVWLAAEVPVDPLLADFANPGLSTPRREVLLAGLSFLVGNQPDKRAAIISGLAGALAASPKEQPTLNGEIVLVLYLLEAVEAKEAIRAAYEEGRVAKEVIEREDIEWLV